MKGRILTEKQIAAFAVYLKSEEKSENTIEKYIRDVKAFATYRTQRSCISEVYARSVLYSKRKIL